MPKKANHPFLKSNTCSKATIIFGGKSIRQISGVLVFIVFLRLVGVFFTHSTILVNHQFSLPFEFSGCRYGIKRGTNWWFQICFLFIPM